MNMVTGLFNDLHMIEFVRWTFRCWWWWWCSLHLEAWSL